MYLRLCDEMKTFKQVVQIGRILVQPSPSNKTRLGFCSILDCSAEAPLVRGIREGCRLCCSTRHTRRRKFWAFVCRVPGPARLGLFGFRQSQFLRDISPTCVTCWRPPAAGTGHMEAALLLLLLLFAMDRQVFHRQSTDIPCIVLHEAGKSPERSTSLTNVSSPHATTHISIFSTVFTGSGTLAASLVQIQVYY
jgi:hypothetical protein